MQLAKYLFIIGGIFWAVKNGPTLWKQYQLNKVIEKSGGMKTFALPANCKGKKYCITVYVSPMSAECKSADTTFFAFQLFLPRLRPEAGYGIIISKGPVEELVAMRRHLNRIDNYVDETGLILKAREIKDFPTWIVTNSNGDEVLRVHGTPRAQTLGEVNKILIENLKL